MKGDAFCFDDAVFTYYVSTQHHDKFEFRKIFSSRELVVSHTKCTSVLIETEGDTSVCIIGLCVDSFGEIERANIPAFLLSCGDIEQLLDKTKRMAGRFAILFEKSGAMYALTDAAGFLSVYYSIDQKKICLSSCDELIRQHFGYPFSKESIVIRNAATYESHMPHDITMCENIKALLPNHYLDLTGMKPVRFFPSKEFVDRYKVAHKAGNYDEMLKRHVNLIDGIISEYTKYYEIVCPVTSGYDSRVNLSFLRRKIDNLLCYTFTKPSFKEDSGDYYVPPMLCDKIGAEHIAISDVCTSEEYFGDLKNRIGEYHSKYTADLAHTFNSKLKGKALVSGCVTEQIGKVCFGNSGPLFLVTPQFFLTRYDNYSSLTKKHIKKHMQAIRYHPNAATHIHDLIGLESFCGRWAAQSPMIYAMMGVNVLNIYNCREIIEGWMLMPRGIRREKYIHYKLIEMTTPELLDVPFNPSKRFERLKANPFTFWVAVHLKWARGKLRTAGGK